MRARSHSLRGVDVQYTYKNQVICWFARLLSSLDSLLMIVQAERDQTIKEWFIKQEPPSAGVHQPMRLYPHHSSVTSVPGDAPTQLSSIAEPATQAVHTSVMPPNGEEAGNVRDNVPAAYFGASQGHDGQHAEAGIVSIMQLAKPVTVKIEPQLDDGTVDEPDAGIVSIAQPAALSAVKVEPQADDGDKVHTHDIRVYVQGIDGRLQHALWINSREFACGQETDAYVILCKDDTYEMLQPEEEYVRTMSQLAGMVGLPKPQGAWPEFVRLGQQHSGHPV